MKVKEVLRNVKKENKRKKERKRNGKKERVYESVLDIDKKLLSECGNVTRLDDRRYARQNL